MGTRNTINVNGKIRFVHKDSKGEVKNVLEQDNLVVNTGLGHIAYRFGGSTGVMDHIAIGYGETAPTPSDTSLESELGSTGISSTTVSGNAVTFTATNIVPASTGLYEAGVFNDYQTPREMLSRVTYSEILAEASDQITIDWTLTFN